MKFRFTVYSGKVRELCIQENYYTKGDNIEYKHMLFTLCRGTTKRAIEKIVDDIIAHSDIGYLKERYHDCPDVKTVITEYIINECTYVSVVY